MVWLAISLLVVVIALLAAKAVRESRGSAQLSLPVQAVDPTVHNTSDGAQNGLKLSGPDVLYHCDEAEIAAIVSQLASSSLLALDIETTPKKTVPADCRDWSEKMKALQPRSADIRLMQFYDGGSTVHVFDMRRIGLEALRPIFRVPLLSHNAQFERSFLEYNGVRVKNWTCTMQMAREFNPKMGSLRNAAKYFLGFNIDKKLQSSDFSGDLTTEQLLYAATDAFVCFRLHERLTAAKRLT